MSSATEVDGHAYAIGELETALGGNQLWGSRACVFTLGFFFRRSVPILGLSCQVSILFCIDATLNFSLFP